MNSSNSDVSIPVESEISALSLQENPISPNALSRWRDPMWWCGVLVVLAAAMRACRPLNGGVDFWAHAAIGRWIWQNQQLPHETLFLWGSAPIEWIAHSWGTQLWFYALMAWGGDYGPSLAIGFTMLMACAPFALLWRAWVARSSPDFLTVSLFALAIIVSTARFKPRPELFSAFFLTLVLLQANRSFVPHEQNMPAKARQIWWLVPIFVLWANFHGAFAFAFALLGLAIIADGVQFRADKRWRNLLLVTVCCVFATIVNPYGITLWKALGAVRSSTFASIEEWKAPWLSPPLSPWLFGSATMLVSFAGAAWLGGAQRRWAHIAWLLFAYVSFLGARRYLWFVAIVCLVVCIGSTEAFERVSFWRRWSPPLYKHPILRWNGVLVAFVMLLAVTPEDIWTQHALDRTVPTRLSDKFIADGWAATKPRLFNDYEYSSYWQWRFGGNPALYIDLLNAYPDQLLENYFDILKQNVNGKRELDRADMIVLRPPSKTERLAQFQKYLDTNPQKWQRLYRGGDGSIWRRRSFHPEHPAAK